MNIIIRIGIGLLIFVLILLLAFLILRINPKPEIIRLERRAVSDEELDKIARDAIGRMTLKEKVSMMTPVLKSMLKFGLEMAGNGMRYNHDSYQAGGNSRLGIPTMRFFDGPRGLVSGQATCFPVSIARAASFDRDLEYRIGDVIGREIRAAEGNYFGGVCINLLRHPAGGRAQEGYGEDSFLTGQMGVSLMKGVQLNNVMACIKHYAVNNQENTRFDVNVEADERVLREVYLSHFRECVDSGAASVMGSYNLFRGDRVCASRYLLTNVLKEDWGFGGFVISDFVFAVKDTELSANAGLDIEMPTTRFYGSKLLKAVQEGRVPEKQIDESAFRVARTVLKYEMAPDPLPDYPESLIGSSDHVALALEAAERSIVLMQNQNKVLPFTKNETKRILVAGKLAAAQNIGDHGSSRVRPAYIVTPLEGMNKLYGPEVEFIYDSGENTDSLKEKIGKADAVVYVVGYNHDDEGEFATKSKYTTGGDRKSLRLHESESRMISETAMLSRKSVVVLIGGSAIIVEEWKDSVGGIIHAFYPGMEGGTAIARVLFGDVNPGGKLPFTVAREESHYPEFDINATEVEYDRYHGYIKLDHDGNKPSFPFGFGLSYTEFSHDSLRVESSSDRITASINVTNTGARQGDQVIQLYIGFDGSKVEREHKLLKGFERISLKPGETRTVSISCPFERLRYYDPDSGSWLLEKMEYQLYMGPSSDEGDLLKSTFRID